MSELNSVVAGLGLGGGVAVAVGVWAWTRLKDLNLRLRISEQQRQQEMQFTTAARRQIESLQNELAEMRALLARRGVQPPPPKPMVVDVTALDAAREAPDSAADGFQATQIVPRATP